MTIASDVCLYASMDAAIMHARTCSSEALLPPMHACREACAELSTKPQTFESTCSELDHGLSLTNGVRLRATHVLNRQQKCLTDTEARPDRLRLPVQQPRFNTLGCGQAAALSQDRNI